MPTLHAIDAREALPEAHTAKAAVDEACVRARKAQQAYAPTSLADRAHLLRRMRAALVRNAEELIAVVRDESGKVRFEAITLEIVPAALALTFNAYVVERALRPERVRPFLPLPRRARRTFSPRGVVGLISPYNYTLAIPMSTLAPALAAGNAVVWKPAPTGIRAAHALVRTFEDAGVPRDLVVVVEGGPAAGGALVEGPIDHLTFVGSTAAGRKVAARCGERLLPCVLELGGNAAAVVTAGADIERASRAIVYGGLANAGQSCVAVERVFAVPEVFDALLERTADLASRIRIGEDVARIDERQRKKVEAWRQQALEHGAVFYGDVVVDVTAARMPVLGGEIFGPVLPFFRVANVDEAVQRANVAQQQLCAYAFCAPAEGRALAKRLKAPHVAVNDTMITYAMMELPFGGDGASGFGRVHGVEGLRALAREQIVVDGKLPLDKEPWWLPYNDGVGELVLRGLEHALAVREKLPW